MIKFSRTDPYVTGFLNRYLAWAALQNLSAPHEIQATIGPIEPDSISIYSRHEVKDIEQDPRRVIGISLKEGIKEIKLLDNILPKNKHYIIFSGSYPTTPPEIELSHTLVCHEGIMAQMYDLHFYSHGTFFCSDRAYDFDSPKPWEFVSFSAEPRPHRIEFSKWLKELPYSNFIYRLNQIDLGQPADHIDFVNFSQINVELSQWFEQTAMHTAAPRLHIMGRIPTKMLNQARFNLVLETAFEFPTFDTTEKTIRALMLGMPFVLASAPGHLKRLHSLGFHTYGHLWDESYDDEPDKDLRLRKVFELVAKLKDFNWDAHRFDLELVGLRNKANFTNLGWWFDQEFRNFEQKIKELKELNLVGAQV